MSLPPKKKKKPVAPPNSRITSFFKSYTVPDDKVPVNDVVEDEIVLAQPRPTPDNVRDGRQTVSAVFSGLPTSSGSTLTVLTTSPPRPTPKKLSLARTSIEVGDDDADDLIILSPGAWSARSLKHVAIPAPTQKSPAPPPRSFAQAQPTSKSVVDMSFSSVSTVTSFGSSASRRVMKGGELAITNSDSDHPDDSSDGLADVSSFVPRKRVKLTPPACDSATPMIASTSWEQELEKKSKRQSDHGEKRRKSLSRVPSPPLIVYKYSLKSLVKQSKKTEESKAKIAGLEAAVHAAESKQAELATKDLRQGDGRRLAAAAANDSDEGERVLQAMGRIESVDQDEHFQVFCEPYSVVPDRTFPAGASEGPWVILLHGNQAREQAVLTGFVTDLARGGRLTCPMIHWFAVQLAHEERQDLCIAYLAILKAAAASTSAMPTELASLERFYRTSLHGGKSVLCVCGSSKQAEDTLLCASCNTLQHISCYYSEHDGQPMLADLEHFCIECRPRPVDHPTTRSPFATREHGLDKYQSNPLPRGLQNVICALRYLAPPGGTLGISKVIADLALANIDERIRVDCGLRDTIQDTMVSLLEHVDVDALYGHVRNHLCDLPKLSLALQCRLVAAMPAFSTHAHDLRRRLALFCITQSDDAWPPTSTEWHCLILDHLKSAPVFAISGKTDYALLKLLTNVLDIAIDAGFSDHKFIAIGSSNLTPTPKALFSASTRGSVTTSSAERSFNQQIDALTSRLALMQNHIKDGGMSQLRRMEAKSALHTLEVRLASSVRTRPKPVKGVFGTRVTGESSVMLDAFLKQDTVDPEDQRLNGATDGDGLAKNKSVRFAKVEEQ